MGFPHLFHAVLCHPFIVKSSGDLWIYDIIIKDQSAYCGHLLKTAMVVIIILQFLSLIGLQTMVSELMWITSIHNIFSPFNAFFVNTAVHVHI